MNRRLVVEIFMSLQFATTISIATQARTATPDGAWTQFGEAAAIPGRSSFAAAYDSRRHRVIAFGGSAGGPIGMQDTWSFTLDSDSVWRAVPVLTAAPARFGHCLVYDSGRDRVLLFAGQNSVTYFRETWFLDLSEPVLQWRPFATYGSPPQDRRNAQAVYDPVNQRVVLFGGIYSYVSGDTFAVAYRRDCWELTLNTNTPTWSSMPAGDLEGRSSAFYGLDTKRNVILLHGGEYTHDVGFGPPGDGTYERNLGPGGTWYPINTVHSPGKRAAGSAVYDSKNDRFVIFGGSTGTSLLSDAWQLSLTTPRDWTPLPPAGIAPAARAGTEAEYDPIAERMLIYGGFGSSVLSETWTFALNGSNAWDAVQALISPRDFSAGVYNPDAQEMLLFGGKDPASNIHFDETWRRELTDATASRPWKRIEFAGVRPAARRAARAVWDGPRHRTIVMGGLNASNQVLNDVWELRLHPTPTWTPIVPQGTSPLPRSDFGLALDPLRDRLILVGGLSTVGWQSDIWELPLSGPSLMTWNRFTLTQSPGMQSVHGMCYEPFRDRMTLFTAPFLNTIELSGAPNWVSIQSAGPSPTPFESHQVVYDAAFNRMVFFGPSTWALNLTGGYQWQKLSPPGSPPEGGSRVAAIYEPLLGRAVMYVGSVEGVPATQTWQLEWGFPSTAVNASLLESHAEPDRVQLAWFAHDVAGVEASVQRHDESTEWTNVGLATIDAGDVLRFEDANVVPGGRYGYRLRLRSGGEEIFTAETVVDVPAGHALRLAGARPNPTEGGPLRVAFSLAKVEDAGRLELLDVSGRRVASRSLQGLPPGTHHITFSEASRAEPGVYLLRMVTADRTLTSKALITR